MATLEQLPQSETIQRWIDHPHSQEIENLASEGHETRRISDPYLFEIKNGQLLTLMEKDIEKVMERHNTLDWNEYRAFKEINTWANDNKEGTIVWISPSYPTIYPVAKAIVSEIFTYNNRKFLLNRNVILDISDSDVLDLANQLSKESKFTNPEELRKAPIILPDYSTEYWQGILESYTNQVRQIRAGEDILAKNKTLKDSEKIIYRVTSLFGFVNYDYAYREAKEEGVVGKQPGSCSGGNSKSPFSIFSENGNMQTGEKSLDCTCPFCKTRVTAIISSGRIHCPNCGKSASYHC